MAAAWEASASTARSTRRSFVSRGGELWFQAGGGIVAKSDPEYELQEVNNKLGALRSAIELAAQF